MIMRERIDSFVLIEQHHHGQLSEEIMRHWKKELFPDPRLRDSVLTAIKFHDLGWEAFDKEPFWNDAKKKPYLFTDFPLPGKLSLYTQGVDEVEKMDTYAAMLCSLHYCQFMLESENADAKKFLKQEEKRRTRLRGGFPGFDEKVFYQHYGLLQLGDNFSLYACVNEPGASKSQEHPFFVNGIPSPEVLHGLPSHRMDIHFTDHDTIHIEGFPFEDTFEICYKHKDVLKNRIREVGLIQAYGETECKEVKLKFSGE